MDVVLRVDGGFLSLASDGGGFDPRRRIGGAVDGIARIGERYAAAREGSDAATLLGLGRELYGWLNGEERWLDELLSGPLSPFVFEVRSAKAAPDPAAWAVLNAPWELLASEKWFLAEDAVLGYAPARRLGLPRAAAPLDDHRLGIAFMASSPRGLELELDYEAEETAILNAAKQGIDLLVEDSGDPEELGRHLAALQPPPAVLHLSCHGHNAWAGKGGQPVLLMEDALGNDRATSAAELLEAVELPRLVFLSACLTAAVGGGRAVDSYASTLIRANVPAVLGWDGSVADVAATAFAQEFYDELAKRRPVVQAAAAARRALLGGTAEAWGSTAAKELPGETGLDRERVKEALRRNWHLARVWLGPEGGGPVVGGTRKRSLLPPGHTYKKVLVRKGGDPRLVVADPSMFVGRRRELQAALRALGDQAGVLLHGMGRLGKSSLAARLADRRRDLAFAVVYEDYNALSVVDALTEALKDHPPARELLAARRPAVRDNPASLEATLIDLLGDPCKQSAGGRPVLLLIDDLERILEADPGGGRHRVRLEERPVLAAVLRAFDPAGSESRLLVTSRFPFSLVDRGEELASRLVELQLPPFLERTQRKLTLRQVSAARDRREGGTVLDDAALGQRQPLLDRAQKVARGNPGLQDLVGNRLVLRPAVPVERAQKVLGEMETYLADGSLPGDEEVRAFLQNLALGELLQQAGDGGGSLLRAATVFQLPVPAAALAALAGGIGSSIGHLSDLGLLDRFEDIVDHRSAAHAVNALAASRLTPLSERETVGMAALALPALFDAWGGAGGRARRAFAADLELTRLGLLVKDADIVAAAGDKAVLALRDAHRPSEAARLGQAAIVLLEEAGRPLPLGLLANTGAALHTIGDGAATEAVLAKGPGAAGAADADPDQVARYLFELGQRQRASGALDAALATFERLCAHEAKRGNDRNFAIARGGIADILEARGELDGALRIRRGEELPVYERLGDVRNMAVTKGQIADILQARGELDEALRTRREEVLPVYERLGDVRSAAVTKGKIADILEARGELDEALRIREEQLPVFERLGDVREIAVSKGRIAGILEARGELDEALRIREEVLPVYERLRDVRSVAVTKGTIADILWARGELDEALRILREEVLLVLERLGDVRLAAVTKGRIAHILAMKGDLKSALALQAERLVINRKLGDADGIAATLWDIAQLEMAQQEYDAALPRLAEAWSIFQKLGGAEGIAIVGKYFGQLLARSGDREKAQAVLGQSAAAYRKLGRHDEAAQAEAIRNQIPE